MYTREQITSIIKEKKVNQSSKLVIAFDSLEKHIDKRLKEIIKERDIKDGKDGETPVKGIHYFDGKDGETPIKGIHYFDGKDGESIQGEKGDDGEDGVDGESVTIDDVRPILEELISGLDLGISEKKAQELLNKHSKSLTNNFNSRLQNLRSYVELNYGGHGGTPSTGGGLTFLPATGTVDSSNTLFTFTAKPIYVVSDGVWLLENTGWTWAGSTATMSVPPQFSIWGFS